MEHFSHLVTMSYAPYAAPMIFPGCDDSFLIPIVHPYICIAYGLSSYLHVCKNFGLFLPFKDLLPSYKDLAYKIDSNLCGLMFFKAPKLKTGIENFNNKFILDLERFKSNFHLRTLFFNFKIILG